RQTGSLPGRNQRAYLFQPRAAYRMRYDPVSGRPGWPEYPPVGAHIDYELTSDTSSDTAIEILDADGTVLRRFKSQPATDDTVAGQDMYPARLSGLATAGPPARHGMNRFLWDLRLDGPWSAAAQVAAEAGPYVVPGLYQVRLTC